MEIRQNNLKYSTNVPENIKPIEKLIKKEKMVYKKTQRVFDIICGILGLIILIKRMRN